MSDLHLKPNPVLADYQSYIADMVAERGFKHETIQEVFLLFLEECGELAKATRKASNMHTDAGSDHHAVEHEAADVFMYLLDICNRMEIDLEKAFREKEEINKKRVWKKSE